MATPVIKWIGERFNTQPRGGGCISKSGKEFEAYGFNTQPRGGGCTAI